MSVRGRMMKRSKIEKLRLCPVDEEGLNELAKAFIFHVKTPLQVLHSSGRKIVVSRTNLGRMIINTGSSIGGHQLSGISFMETLYNHYSSFTPTNFLELNDCILIGRQLIISSINSKLKSHLLKKILQNIFAYPNLSEASDLLFLLWNLRDQILLSAETLEELIQGYPKCLEVHLMDIIERVLSSEEELSDIFNDDLILFCKLCSESPKLFQIVLTILHELLLLSNAHKLVLKFIQRFVYNIQIQCKNIFIDLFPEHLHLLVNFLQIKPILYPDSFFDSNFTRNNVLKNLSSLLCRDLRVGTALLCYYPQWLLPLFNYCTQNNISKLIPNFKVTDDSCTLYLQFLVHAVPFA